MHPSDPKYNNILLTSCGLFPQIITEIIYALSHQKPAVLLDEIHVITTQVGLDQIKKYLLDENDGFFYKLCDEYGIRGTKFELKNVQLLENAMGISLEDIESLDDNEIVANTITETVRELTARPENALHVSLTGGRRTASYYLGYALSLFGRPQDRLSHTLVSDAFAADDEFFYPNKAATFITDRKGKALNTQDAKVQLVEIPFVHLRNGLPKDLLAGKTTFVDAVNSITSIERQARLEINLADRTLLLNDISISLPPVLFGWYAWLATRRCELGPEAAEISVRSDHHLDFITFIESIFGTENLTTERAKNTLAEGFSIDYISEKNSRINTKLSRILNMQALHFKIMPFGKRPHTTYCLTLKPNNILITKTPS